MNREEIPEDLCRLLDAERDRPGPTPDDVERALTRFNAQLTSAPGVEPVAPSVSAAPSQSLAARALGPLLGLAIGAGLGYAVGVSQAPPEPAVPAISAATATAVAPTLSAAPTDALIPTDLPLEPSAAPSPAAPRPHSTAPSGQAPSGQSAQPSTPPASTLREERILLERARSALLRGDTAAALSACALHQQRFPRGQLSQEREALRKQASAPGPKD